MSKRRADASDTVVGHNIRAHRLVRQMSQTDLARAIGVTFQQVQKYEKGKTRVGAARLVQVASALGVPATALLQGVRGTSRKSADPALAALLANGRRLRLVQAFARIEDASVQQALLALTELLARLGERGRVGRRSPDGAQRNPG